MTISYASGISTTPLLGETIEADLSRRDLTINAIAEPLGPADGAPVDPYGGIEDLEGRRLRMVSEHAFRDDPVRVLRLSRHACELDFAVEASRGYEFMRVSRSAHGRIEPHLKALAQFDVILFNAPPGILTGRIGNGDLDH